MTVKRSSSISSSNSSRRQGREAVPVTLTPLQRKRLENLWFLFGNYGPKTTKGNHSFIQGLLERGEDERPLRIKGYLPTEECERAVDEILTHAEGKQTQAGFHENTEEQKRIKNQFRLIATEQKMPTSIDPEMKALIEEMKQRAKRREQISSDEPDAA